MKRLVVSIAIVLSLTAPAVAAPQSKSPTKPKANVEQAYLALS